MFGLRQETVSGRPHNFDHGEGKGGLWQQYHHCNPEELPPGLLWSLENVSSNVLSSCYDQQELQPHLDPLRQRSGSFYPSTTSTPLELYKADTHVLDLSHAELRIDNHFQPTHAHPNARMLEVRMTNGILQLREPCPRFQLRTIANVATAMYGMHPITAYVCAVRTTIFNDVIPYRKFIFDSNLCC